MTELSKEFRFIVTAVKNFFVGGRSPAGIEGLEMEKSSFFKDIMLCFNLRSGSGLQYNKL